MRISILRRAPSRVAPALYALAGVIALAWADASLAQTLTLQDAFIRAASADPSFSAADARIDAATAAIRQSDTRPNPSVGLEVENFAGTGPIGLFGESVTTLGYAQQIERGGKREARVSLARAGLQTAEIEKQVHALDLFEGVEKAWIEALAAEAAIGLNEDRLAAAQRLLAETERRVQAAREPEFAGARIAALVAEAEIALMQARNDARTTKAALAAFWEGAPEFSFDTAILEEVDAVPSRALDDRNLDLVLISSERDRAGAAITLEQTRAIQDPTVSGGLRHFANGGDVALVAHVAIPLPLYNDNSGNIARAVAERRAVDHEYAVRRREIQRELTTLEARLAAHAEEAAGLAESAIPQAERALDLVREGFDRGAFEYIDIIDAERNVNNARTRRLEILREYHLDLARLNRITGAYLSVADAWEAR